MGSRKSRFRIINIIILCFVVLVSLSACGKSPALPSEAVCGVELNREQRPKLRNNKAVREWYLAEDAKIAGLDEGWAREGKTLEERARLAHKFRRDARIEARRKMPRASDVEALCKRDQDVYGDPQGPTFEFLVNKYRKAGASEEEIYKKIIYSSQRTNRFYTFFTDAYESVRGLFD